MSGLPLLSLLIAIPLVAGVLCLFVSDNGARWTALIATLIDFALSLDLWVRFNPDGAQWQFIEKVPMAGGVSWALGVGRGGSIVGSLIGGVMLAQGLSLAMVYGLVAVPAFIAAL